MRPQPFIQEIPPQLSSADQKGLGLTIDLRDPTETPMYTLREECYLTSYYELQDRLQNDPTPTQIEYSIGMFVECLEPGVREAVVAMWHKGYPTISSGFAGLHHEYQRIDGYFELSPDTVAALAKKAVAVERVDSMTSIFFCNPEEASIAEIRNRWLDVVALLPDTGHRAIPVDPFSVEMAETFKQMVQQSGLRDNYLTAWLRQTGNLVLHPALREQVQRDQVISSK